MEEELSPTSNTTNLLANSELSSTATSNPNGEAVKFRHKTSSFTIEDDSSLIRNISAARSLSLNSDRPFSWFEDPGTTESLVALLSALYALVLIIFSVTIELSMVLHAKRIVEMPWLYECFHIYLYGVALTFFGYCYGFMLNRGWIRDMRTREASLKTRISKKSLSESQSEHVDVPNDPRRSMTRISHSGPTAGSLYLRMGCIVFGIVGVVSIGMQIFECVETNYKNASGLNECSSLRIFKLGLAIIFTFVQMHFIFQNSKVTIHRAKNVARFGTMHLIAGNLWVWMRTLILEVSHVIDHARQNTSVNSSLCTLTSESDSSETTTKSSGEKGDKETVKYLLTGCVDSASCFMQEKFGPIMSTCTIEYSLIAACVMFVLWRNIGMPALAASKGRKNNLRVDCGSSTTGMFGGLVFLVGTFVSMIVFNKADDSDALLVFGLTHIGLYVVSILACLTGIWRMRLLSYDTERHATGAQLLEDILLIVGLFGQLLFSISGIVGLSSATNRDQISPHLFAVLGAHIIRLMQVLMQTVFILGSSRMIAATRELQRTKPGREVVTFMIVVNMALFLVNTFEGQGSINGELVNLYELEAAVAAPERDRLCDGGADGFDAGSTTVTAKLDNLKATVHIVAFPPLKLHSAEQPLVALGSSFLVNFEGGPRPWVLEPAKYFTKLEAETKNLVTVKDDGQSTFKVMCGNTQGETTLLLSVGNRKSSSNPLPVISKAKIIICCSLPDRLVLSPFRTVVDSTLPPCPATSHSVYFGEASRLLTDGYGRCSTAGSEDRRFNSIDSLILEWSTTDNSLLTVVSGKRHLQQSQNKCTAFLFDCSNRCKEHLALLFFFALSYSLYYAQ